MNPNAQTPPAPSHASNGVVQQIERKAGASWRSIWMSAGGLLVSLAALCIFLEFFVAHRLPPLSEATLDAAEKLWAHSAPPSYNLDLEIRGAQPGPVHVHMH